MYGSNYLYIGLTGLTLACAGFAQTDPPQTANTFLPTALPSAGPIKFSGLVDGYYSLNFNHPDSGVNTLRNFDTRANYPAINMGIIGAEMAPAPVGFKFQLGFGHAFDIFNGAEPGRNDAYKYIYQAYASLKPASWKGFQVDVGKFVTSAGAEVTETHLNWNYSRSFLYANGPYYHFGIRTTMPVTKNFTAGFQLVNGWNNVEENNSGKTMGFTTALTTSKVNWSNAYYVGPEKAHTNEGWRHFYDTVVTLNPNGKVNGLFNFDYGQENNPGAPAYKFYGMSGAVRFVTSKKTAISPRYDWYKDRDGFITGQPQTLQEFTLTADYKLADGFLSRFEYRRDWSDQPYFDRGFERGNWKNMNTLLVGFVVYLGPKQ
jgi:Putative beta-barrel porin-2, OmpL-like. bbp2